MAERSIATELLTPKSSAIEQSPAGAAREQLLTSQRLANIQECYEQAQKQVRVRGSENSNRQENEAPLTPFDAMTKAAQEVAELVRQTIDFGVTTDATPLLDASSIAEREAANCEQSIRCTVMNY